MVAPDSRAGFGIDAVEMPLPFVELVVVELCIAMQAGPVVADRMRRVATFLTLPAPSRRLPPDLTPFGVRLVPVGQRLLLPGRADHVSWLVSPSRPLAVWTAVLATARRVAQYRAAERMALPELPTAPKAA